MKDFTVKILLIAMKKAGYGIGLSIAEELVKLLKGTIKVSYNKGKITFIVKFTN